MVEFYYKYFKGEQLLHWMAYNYDEKYKRDTIRVHFYMKLEIFMFKSQKFTIK